MASRATLDVLGKKVDVTNLDKIFYPKTGFTKGEVIDYYARISPYLLPHLRDRAISLKRYPEGVEGFHFYEKNAPSHRPDWIETSYVAKSEGGGIDYCVLGDLPSLIWAANLANLELHTFLHRIGSINKPAALAFDLDPGAPADIVNCCQVGLWLKALFDALQLESFPKTSGSKGLQVYLPLHTPVAYEKTKDFALAIAQMLEQKFPNQVLSRMQRNLRGGKVFVDWSQNDDKKTTVNVYSLRAKEYPTVSTPVTWEEVTKAFKKKDSRLLTFEANEVLQRVEKLGDLFEPVLTLKQKLPTMKALEKASGVLKA